MANRPTSFRLWMVGAEKPVRDAFDLSPERAIVGECVDLGTPAPARWDEHELRWIREPGDPFVIVEVDSVEGRMTVARPKGFPHRTELRETNDGQWLFVCSGCGDMGGEPERQPAAVRVFRGPYSTQLAAAQAEVDHLAALRSADGTGI